MSRHHPYGPQYDNFGPRRGGTPSGPGPDRYHRFDGPPRGRGFGRGRGRGSFGGASHDFASNPPIYDQAPSQGNMGGYNNYNSGPNQDSFYQNDQNGGYANQFSDSDTPGGYDQSYGNGNFQDGTGPGYGGPGGYGARLPKRGPKRERDDKMHESIIEERIQRERPCRTLFIRNIKYETNSDEVRRQFEEHGEIKTFFDLIANRGMVFVTFYDLRAAERARDRLQGSEISGRPIDVHYSLPRDDNLAKGGDKNQELQGTLLVTLRNSNQTIDDGEVRRKFQQFGDVKSVRPAGERHDQRYVEFYDTRSAEEAFDRLRHQGLQDGVMDIVLAWDETSGPPIRREEREPYREWDEAPRPGPFRGKWRGRGRGRGFASAGHDDDRRPHWDRDRDRPKRYEDDHGSHSGRGGGRGSYNDRFDGNREGGYNNASQNNYAMPTQQQYAEPSPAAPRVEERIDQARKVQQLLAALKQPQAASSGAQPTQVQAQPPTPVPQLPQNSFYPPAPAVQQPPPMYSGGAPPTNPGFPPLSPTNLAQGGPPSAQTNPLVNLPSNIIALLQSAQAQQQPSSDTPQAPQSSTPLPGAYGTVHPSLPQGQMRPPMPPPHLTGPPPPTVPMQGGMGGDYPAQTYNYFAGTKRT